MTVGKTLAFTSILFRNASDEVVARGSHTKYIALAWRDPQNITDELSPKVSASSSGGRGKEKEKKPSKEQGGKSEKEVEKEVENEWKEKESEQENKGKKKAGAQDGNVPEGFEKLPNVPS